MTAATETPVAFYLGQIEALEHEVGPIADTTRALLVSIGERTETLREAANTEPHPEAALILRRRAGHLERLFWSSLDIVREVQP